MKEIIVRETYWYLAFQDGPADERKFSTEAEARKAWDEYDADLRRGVCVMSRTHERSL